MTSQLKWDSGLGDSVCVCGDGNLLFLFGDVLGEGGSVADLSGTRGQGNGASTSPHPPVYSFFCNQCWFEWHMGGGIGG